MDDQRTASGSGKSGKPRDFAAGIIRQTKRMDRLPPFFVYYMARTDRRGTFPDRRGIISTRRIPYRTMIEHAETMGMSERSFVRLVNRVTWLDISPRDQMILCRVCRFDFSDTETSRRFAKNSFVDGEFSPEHLNTLQKRRFKALVREWYQTMRAEGFGLT